MNAPNVKGDRKHVAPRQGSEGLDAPTDAESRSGANSTSEIALERLHVSPLQPRRSFDEQSLRQLADSLRRYGLLQPILVRPHPSLLGNYEVVAGERRLRAARLGGLTRLSAVVRNMTDKDCLEAALLENIQRQNLNPMEEAEAYLRLIQEFRYPKEKLAGIVGKSRSHVSNRLRMLRLPETVQEMVREGALSVGQTRPLVGREDAEKQAQHILKTGTTARQAEKLARYAQTDASLDSQLKEIERALSKCLGLQVEIHLRSVQKGSLRIAYTRGEQLKYAVQVLKIGSDVLRIREKSSSDT